MLERRGQLDARRQLCYVWLLSKSWDGREGKKRDGRRRFRWQLLLHLEQKRRDRTDNRVDVAMKNMLRCHRVKASLPEKYELRPADLAGGSRLTGLARGPSPRSERRGSRPQPYPVRQKLRRTSFCVVKCFGRRDFQTNQHFFNSIAL